MSEKWVEYIMRMTEESASFRKLTGHSLATDIAGMAEFMTGIIGGGGKILICGNGGSAADSSHMATELIVRLTALNNRRSLPAISLNSDGAVLTAAGNDFGFENIFARQVEGLASNGDLLFMISTTGNSKNLILAAETARAGNIRTAALLGNDGGKLKPLADKSIIVPPSSVQRIQEEHIFIIHLLVELIESDLIQ
jgi:D-sedoheptulose 7-phosphate isomerase